MWRTRGILAEQVGDDQFRVPHRVGCEGFCMASGHLRAEPFGSLSDGEGKRRIGVDPSKLVHRIPSPSCKRVPFEPPVGGQRHRTTGADARPSFVGIVPCGLRHSEFLFDERCPFHRGVRTWCPPSSIVSHSRPPEEKQPSLLVQVLTAPPPIRSLRRVPFVRTSGARYQQNMIHN